MVPGLNRCLLDQAFISVTCNRSLASSASLVSRKAKGCRVVVAETIEDSNSSAVILIMFKYSIKKLNEIKNKMFNNI